MSSSLNLDFGGRKAIREENLGKGKGEMLFSHIEFGRRALRPGKLVSNALDLLQQHH